MANLFDGHGDGASKPGVGKGSFEGVGSFAPKPGTAFKSDAPIGNHGRSSTVDSEKLEWPGSAEFNHGEDGDQDKA